MNSLEELVLARPASDNLSGWKLKTGTVCALLLSLLFFVSGIWKLSDLEATRERMIQSLIPLALSMAVSIAVAISEVFTAVLLLIPRFRRWGGWLATLMLVAFMIYIGVLYDRLIGEDCNCFPWLQRVVGPVFFIGDAAMLALAVAASWWSRPSQGWRHAASALAVICVIAGGCYAATQIRRGQMDAPEMATVDGQPVQLRQGKVLLYFFDPECMHCLATAREMAKRPWGETRVVALATRLPQYAKGFLKAAGLHAGISPDAETLRKAFPFTDPPYAVALDRGKAVATFNSGQLEVEAYYETLARLSFLQGASAK
jgi:uncharacterized membrane protein